MTPLIDMERALGRPYALIAAPVSDGENAFLGRWRHTDAEPRLASGDGMIKIVFNLSNTQKVERLRHGVWTSKPFDICSFALVPPDEDICFSVKGSADVLQIFLPQNLAAREAGRATCPPIRPRFQDHDPKIERYALLLMAAVQEDSMSRDICLAELIAGLADLLAHDGHEQSSHVKGGLTPYRLRRVMDLITTSVSAPRVEAIRLDQLASAAELSPFHFARAFRETVGLSPYGYVLRKRLERARSMLAKSLLSVAEVAQRTGFASHAHFSNQFRQQMGISPLTFRRAVHPDYDLAAM